MRNPDADNAGEGEQFASVVVAKLSFVDSRRLYDAVLAYLDPEEVDEFTRAFLAEMKRASEYSL